MFSAELNEPAGKEDMRKDILNRHVELWKREFIFNV